MKKPQPTGYGWLIEVEGNLVEVATDTEALELAEPDDEDD